MKNKNIILLVITFLLTVASVCAVIPPEPENLALLRKAYPDVLFTCNYDSAQQDYLITIQVDGRTADLYWADGSLLPKEELPNKEKYWSLLYTYADEVADPKYFTKEEIEEIRKFTSNSNRQNGAGSPPFFFDVLYDCTSRKNLENHIVQRTFLGKRTNIHERIEAPLQRVESRIRDLAKTNTEVAAFVQQLLSADSYSWREISDSNKRSFHSLGIAIDVLPKGWGQKNVYWAWRRDIDSENWMLLPLDRRWMPPKPVISIFEDEGFIYGGKWIIWDNMHFEYHPELILYRDTK